MNTKIPLALGNFITVISSLTMTFSVSSKYFALSSFVDENISKTFHTMTTTTRDAKIMRSTVIIVGILSFTLVVVVHRQFFE